jgi:hypothetical protein
VRETVPVYCEDCPFPELCHPSTGNDCSYARTIKRWLDDAPPLSAATLQKVARILSTATPPATPKRGTGRTPGPFKCLVPGCIAAPLKHRDGLGAHLHLFHDLSLADYVEQYGELEPVEEEVVVVACPVEWCATEYSTPNTRWPRQALVSHMRGVHAVRLKRDGAMEPILPPSR